MSWMNWRQATGICLFSLVIVSLSGCGQNPYATASVTGTVLCNGEPAVGGTVLLQPIDAPGKTGRPRNRPGQTARGVVGDDGTFSVELDSVGDDMGRSGALIGPHLVIFIMPQTEPRKLGRRESNLPPEELAKLQKEIADEPLYEPFACGRAIWPDTIEVKPGSNVFDFVLLPKSFEPEQKERLRGHVDNQEHIKVDRSKLDPALLARENE